MTRSLVSIIPLASTLVAPCLASAVLLRIEEESGDQKLFDVGAGLDANYAAANFDVSKEGKSS